MEHNVCITISEDLKAILNRTLDIWEKKTTQSSEPPPSIFDSMMPGMSKIVEESMQHAMNDIKEHPELAKGQIPGELTEPPHEKLNIDEVSEDKLDLVIKSAINLFPGAPATQKTYIAQTLDITEHDAEQALKKHTTK